MTKLKQRDFDKQYRLREYRGGKGSARCQLCRHCIKGYCIHPKRARRVILSDPPYFGGKQRSDWSYRMVCDLVEIPVPEGIILPELGDRQAISFWLKTRGWIVLHGDPHCPYIAAAAIDGELDLTERRINIRDLSGLTSTGLDDQCDLPMCRGRIGLPAGRPDYYLSKVGFPCELEPPPPPPPVVPDGDEPDDLDAARAALTPILYPFGEENLWPSEAVIAGSRMVKGLLEHHELRHVAPTSAHPYHGGIEWRQLRFILDGLGWANVGNYVPRDLPGWCGHPIERIPWTDKLEERGVELVRHLSRDPILQYVKTEADNPGQPGVDWSDWRFILEALGWNGVVDRITFLRAVRGGQTYCIPCGLSRKKDVIYNFSVPEHPPLRSGDRPICPNCYAELTCWTNFINAMPE